MQRSVGTESLAIRNKVKALVQELRDDRRWTLLEAVTSKPPRLTLLQLYEANAARELDQLEATLSAVQLADVREDWLASVRARLGGSVDEPSSVQNYAGQVDTFLTLFPSATTADITPAKVTKWLATRLSASPGTRRKYLYALKSLVAYCIEAGHLKVDPLSAYKAPKKNRARERWESEENDRRITDAAIERYRAFFAFIKATGCDVGAARRTLARDLFLSRGRALLRGTKTRGRQVHEGEIEAWAIPYLEEHLKGKLPSAPLWPDVTNSGASHHHNRCCTAVGVDDYTLKDARHSVAVRMRFAGRSFEEIAEQLGNSPAVVASTYARFKPADRDKNSAPTTTETATSPQIRSVRQ